MGDCRRFWPGCWQAEFNSQCLTCHAEKGDSDRSSLTKIAVALGGTPDDFRQSSRRAHETAK